MILTTLDLFSGIGGFALGLEATDFFETSCFVENEPYCQAVLRHHWPDVPILGDIRDVKGSDLPTQPDVISGGFPCQPFSRAGKQRGQDDPRHLWPEMLRLIRECRPTWVIGENVTGLIRLGLDEVLSDLAAEGYATRTFNIPACAVGAPHLRQRLWVVAHSDRQGEPDKPVDGEPGSGQLGLGFVADTQRKGKGGRRVPRPGKDKSEDRQGSSDKFRGCREDVANTDTTRRQRGENPKRGDQSGHAGCNGSAYGQSGEEWWEVEPPVGRLVDGLPNRVSQLRALGNSIVPQIAQKIGEAIRETYHVRHRTQIHASNQKPETEEALPPEHSQELGA
jgi:DNA (cytosine-5)-methyltransferase 1